jgi:hypothetical protein
MLSLCYFPQLNKITVVVNKAKDLPQKDMCGTSGKCDETIAIRYILDPYVKMWLFHGTNKLEKHKTTVKNQCLAPVYNESFTFIVPGKEAMETEVNMLVTVC